MAQVFLARDPVLSRFVAIKVLHAELASRKDVLQRFFNEARTVAVVRNPHVVEVFDFGQEGKDLYLVMEFVDGLSLHGVLRQLRINHGHTDRQDGWKYASAREGAVFFDPLDATVTAALMCQAAEGLSMAARHGVVHRDIKPENLMINTQGYLKISDFGIAHVQDDSITKTGAVLGSPLYMSPEQARGLKPITSQADMFSLGAVCYSCLVGHPPFQGKSITDLFRKIATEPHTPLWRVRPDLDPVLGHLIETLLSKDASDRGGGPRWLHRQLKGYLMALDVMDPAELVSGYLQQLAAKGLQTTWRMEEPDAGRPGTLPAGTRHAAVTERYTRESARRVPAAALGAVLGILAMAAGGAMWGFLHKSAHPAKADRPLQAAAQGNTQETLASFASGEADRSASSGAPASAGGRGQGVPDPMHPDPAHSDAAAGEDGRSGDTAAGGPSVRDGLHPGADSGSVSLLLKSSPPFAEAFVDGRFVGVTPVKVEVLAAGRHRVLLKVRHSPALDTVLSLRQGVQGFKFQMEEGLPSRLAVTPEGP